MRKKRHTHFSFLWNGILHLDDGSEWHLVDNGRTHDVIWWLTGEEVEFDRRREMIILRNRVRDEIATVSAMIDSELKLAA